MKYHHLSSLFPLMNQEELSELAADIKKNGLKEPIWTYKDEILDGRNRYQACEKVGIEPEYREYKGDDPLSFVLSLNLHRRHLTASQKAALAVEVLPYLEKQAKERMSKGGKGKQKVADPGQARDKAAEQLGVNRQYVSDAKAIKRTDQKLFEKLKSGELTIAEAKQEAGLEKKEFRLPEPQIKQDVRRLKGLLDNNSKNYDELVRATSAVVQFEPLTDEETGDAFIRLLIMKYGSNAWSEEEIFEVTKEFGMSYKRTQEIIEYVLNQPKEDIRRLNYE